MLHLTNRNLTDLESLLEGEYLAAKKTGLYANTLLDTALAEGFQKLETAHWERFQALYRLIGGEA